MPPFMNNIMSTWYGGEASQTLPLQTTPAVSITLTPVSGPDDRRHITLHANRPLTVGRSSKSETKNLVPGEQNALFDCPVVSRKHAELEFKPNPWDDATKQVILTDRRSMHGTTVNGHKLQKDVPFHLKSGDTIKFGERVAREQDTHEGIAVAIRIIGANPPNKRPLASTAKTTSGYQVPSDSEYDSDDAESNYSRVDDQVSSPHTTPDQGNAAPGSRKSPIDVDSDKSPAAPREIIDLDPPTYPPASAQRAPPRPSPRTIVPDSLDPFIIDPLPSLTGQPVNAAFHPRTSQTAADADNESVLQHNTGLARILQAARGDEGRAYGAARPSSAAPSDHSDIDSEHADADAMYQIGDFYVDTSESEEDDEDGDENDQLVSMHSQEGPEEQSSKRHMSPELGTLGLAILGTHNNPAPVKPPYDPVRASQPEPTSSRPEPAAFSRQETSRHRPYDPYTTSMSDLWSSPADYVGSSRWDVGPEGLGSLNRMMNPTGPVNISAGNTSTTHFGSDYHPLGGLGFYAPPPPPVAESVRPSYGVYVQPELPADPAPTSSSSRSGFGPAPIPPRNISAAMPQPTVSETVKPAKLSIMDLVEDRKNEIEQRIAPQISSPPRPANGKRKADDISTDEPIVIAPAGETVMMEHDDLMAPGPDTSIPLGPSGSKSERPIKKARFQRAATEMGKYAVGMALGGVGTIAFLCSPLAEKLLASR